MYMDGRNRSPAAEPAYCEKKSIVDSHTPLDPFEGRPGPIELQSDHGSVECRNLVLAPLTQRNGK